jgi:hypothetical protein
MSPSLLRESCLQQPEFDRADKLSMIRNGL